MEEQRARQEAENPAAAADKPAEGGDAAKVTSELPVFVQIPLDLPSILVVFV